ncbi:MAG: neutral zinc metallopeptidase [Gammaproteobacteria bacterium]
MRLGGERPSRNVEDRRGRSGGSSGGRGMRLPIGRRGGGLGIGGIVILMGVMWLLGMNPLDLLTGGGQFAGPQQQGQTAEDGVAGTGDDARRDFVARVLGTTERAWEEIFTREGAQYPHPTLQLFSDSTQSACGQGAAAMGPFYCPADSTIYIDLSFFRDLENRLGAPGDFAQAYVIAHEVGHHVQNVSGTLERTNAERAQLPDAEANELSVRVELQADCYAGIWGHSIAQDGTILEDGDIEEGMNAASAIGDDRLQKQSQDHVVPESFTHGTSEQRMRWFRRGLDSGDLAACDTFGADRL